jgi:2-polyprenyl-6-hydroxyphenyl methylase/3-demethylubiquinone-9 3-methyltransferase
MKRLTDVQYWDESWWKDQHPRRLRLYRDFDFETVRLLHEAVQAVGGLDAVGRPRVLEVGAGGSLVLPYLARKFGYLVFGSDFSLGGCRLLRANLALQEQRGGVVCEDLFQSSLRQESFDVVYSSGLIEHFDDTRAVVAEQVRLLKPGGRLVAIVPNGQGVQGKITRRLAPPLWEKHRILAPQELEECLRSLGLVSTRSGYLGSFLIQVGISHEWTVVRRWPRSVQLFVHMAVRMMNGAISFFFRLLPLRPHSRILSHGLFALGTKPTAV